MGSYTFKTATSEAELEAVHRLNYRTFAQELRQHAETESGRLVDRFHDQNTYFIALRGERVVGMLCAHAEPPFSIALRLPDPDVLARLAPRPLEVRLLAVEPDERFGLVFAGLGHQVLEHARRLGSTHLLISGLETRRRLYEGLGFRQLGPAVPDGQVRYIPMALAIDEAPGRLRRDAERWRKRIRKKSTPGMDS